MNKLLSIRLKSWFYSGLQGDKVSNNEQDKDLPLPRSTKWEEILDTARVAEGEAWNIELNFIPTSIHFHLTLINFKIISKKVNTIIFINSVSLNDYECLSYFISGLRNDL